MRLASIIKTEGRVCIARDEEEKEEKEEKEEVSQRLCQREREKGNERESVCVN